MEDNNIFSLLKRLYPHISKRKRWQCFILLTLILLSSLAEVISIGAVLPFLGALSSPERVFTHPLAQTFIQYFNIASPEQLLLPLTIIFASAAVFAGAIRLLVLWLQTRLSFSTAHELGVSIYNRTLFQPYTVHASRNSSEVINGIYAKAGAIASNAILPMLTIINAAAMLCTILVAITFIEPFTALTTFGGFGLLYLGIIGVTRKKLLSDSKIMANRSNEVIKTLQEGLGSIRDVIIYGTQKTYCNTYKVADLSLRRALGNTAIISQSPRFIMEALGIMLMTILAYKLTQSSDGIIGAIPILGSIALAAQRLLPLLQQAYQSWSAIRSGQASLFDALKLLEQPLPTPETLHPQALPFDKSITLKGIYFSYLQHSPWVLQDINLNIEKGSRTGFIGATGSGKSTLLDIIMGLLEPSKGQLYIDNHLINANSIKSWQQHIAHVPQTIFLSDNSIAENIACGIPKEKIDIERVKHAAAQAQIAETIESWDETYQTHVGERGIRLSGGQRQRIGIARALYRKANVIIFDEATSALDSKTEETVMKAIDGLNKNLTILIIAHRISTLRGCDKIVSLGDAKIQSINDYHDLIIN